MGHSQIEGTKLMCENTLTIKLSKNPVLHGRSKHIRVRLHFLRDLTKEETVNLNIFQICLRLVSKICG